MQIRPIVIAIDGYSSTGKSSFAKLLAAKLNFIYIDTGALYRTVTLIALRNNLITKDNEINTERLSELLSATKISFRINEENSKSEPFITDEPVEKYIRSLEIANSVSYIAALDFVRDYVDEILRDLGKEKNVIMDGRDIGTAVFPEAELKIFMTAEADIRAKRRMMEMQSKGEKVDYEEIKRNLEERDYIDQHREMNPLTKADDAIVLDNSYMTIEQELEWVMNYIYENFNR